MERAKVLFGCYRRGDANDPDQYVASIAAVLTLYEPDLMRQATDPRSGISTNEKFCDYMPNSGQLKVFCDEMRDRKHRYDRLASTSYRPSTTPPIDDTPGRRAQIFVRDDASQYPRCLELSKTADTADWKWDENGRAGIWVSIGLYYANRAAPEMKQWAAPTDAELRARYSMQQQAAESSGQING